MPSDFRSRFLAIDLFGHPINLNYKGQETHKTLLGSSLSLLVFALTLIIAIMSL